MAAATLVTLTMATAQTPGPGPVVPGEPIDLPLSASERKEVIDRAIVVLNEQYLFPAVAANIEKAIRANETQGRYNRIDSSIAFATKLTEDLQAIAHDLHLRVRFQAGGFPPMPPPDTPVPPELIEAERTFLGKLNYHFDNTQVLAGNVGYIRVNGFVDGIYLDDVLGGAMEFVARTDSMIIDARHNAGGAPSGVAHFASYFFGPTPLLLNEIHYHRLGIVDRFHTQAQVKGPRYLGKPVYVLTGPMTFSAGEEFSYDLQQHGRAVTIGEASGGGAHVAHGVNLTERFGLSVPVGEARNPVSGSNWERTGVIPDIAVPAELALLHAHVVALKARISSPELAPDERFLIEEALRGAEEDLAAGWKEYKRGRGKHGKGKGEKD